MKVRTARGARGARSVAAVLAVLTMGSAAACDDDTAAAGGGAKDGAGQQAEASRTPSGTPSSTAASNPAAKTDPRTIGRTLSKQQLEKAVLVQGDVKGYTIGAMPGGADAAPGDERADRAACKPLTSVLSGTPQPAATDTVYRQILGTHKDKKKPMQQAVLTEYLSAHKPQEAPKVLAELRAAVKNCAGGFTSYGTEGESTYSAVKELPTVQAGDESFAYQVTGDLDGESVPLVFHVVRSGATVATFYTANLVDARTPEMPSDVLEKQAAKLE